MKELDLGSWEDFEKQLRELQQEKIRLKAATGRHVSELLFRGQRDHEWKLETTLERQGNGPWSFDQYYRIISRARPQIEALTGVTWAIKDYSEYRQWLDEYDSLMPGKFHGYEYMVYLRHHGFPSPLLDWTRSAYVASYFAFAHAVPLDGQVSVYALLEHAGNAKIHSSDAPHIHGFGPYVRTHKRHFLQQCEYSICMLHDQNRGWCYAPHQDAFARNSESQDLLWKFNIPAAERLKVLKVLDDVNINAFSLFGSEEGLMETMALREFHFRATDV
jgi:hypothetical protein